VREKREVLELPFKGERVGMKERPLVDLDCWKGKRERSGNESYCARRRIRKGKIGEEKRIGKKRGRAALSLGGWFFSGVRG